MSSLAVGTPLTTCNVTFCTVTLDWDRCGPVPTASSRQKWLSVDPSCIWNKKYDFVSLIATDNTGTGHFGPIGYFGSSDSTFWVRSARTLQTWFRSVHQIHFMFGSRVEFSGTADRMDLLPIVLNPRFGRPPSWKISNDHISGMSYPIHFHELLQSSFGGIGLQEKIMREE